MLNTEIKYNDIHSKEIKNILETKINLFHIETGYIDKVRANINLLLADANLICSLSLKQLKERVQENYTFTDKFGKEVLIVTINGYGVMSLDGRKTHFPKTITFFNNFVNNTSKLKIENSTLLAIKNLFLTTFTNGAGNVLIDSWVDKYESYLLVESIKTKSNIEFLMFN